MSLTLGTGHKSPNAEIAWVFGIQEAESFRTVAGTAIIFRQLLCALRLSNLQPIRSPSGPLPEMALDLDVRKVRALIDDRIF